MASIARTSEPILCLVTDRSAACGDLIERVEAAVRAGVDWVQIRERELEGAALLAHAEAVADAARRAARGRSIAVVVNRRLDVALAIGADGVQLGFDALPARAARELLGASARIGISAHTPGEIQRGAPEVDFALLAPVFRPISKQRPGPFLGAAAVREAARGRLPVIAQGGICAANACELIAAGAAGVAVTGAILGAPDPADATRALRAALCAANRLTPAPALAI